MGITKISWEFAAPVMCVLAPRITTPSGRRSTMWTYRSGSACCQGARDRSPFGSVIAPADIRSSRCSRARNVRNRWWYSVPFAWSTSYVTDQRALIASSPTHRWKQVPVSRPMSRSMAIFRIRSSTLQNRCVNREIFAPSRFDVAVMISSCCPPAARSYVAAAVRTWGASAGWSYGFSSRFPR